MIRLNTKLIKDPDRTTVFTLNLTAILGDKEIASIVSESIEDNTMQIDYIQQNSSAITVESVTIEAHKALQFAVTNGNSNQEYKINIKILLNTSEDLEIECIIIVTKQNINYYGSIFYANDYFALRLNSNVWEAASNTEKLKALFTASISIDRLNYAESKTDTDQTLEFPRNGTIEVPNDIERACYEEAFSLLSGADSQLDQTNLGVVSEGFSSVRTTYERTFVQENVRAGITSQLAWGFLRPYLRDPNEITLCRV